MLTYGRGVLLLTGVWVSTEASASVLWFTTDYIGKERFWRKRFCSALSRGMLFSVVIDGLVTLKWQSRMESLSEL